MPATFTTHFTGVLLPRVSPKAVRMSFWLACFGLGVLQLWLNRNEIMSDGISYLDMGDAFVRGDWSLALSTIWSPLYGWFLGVMVNILAPSPQWESLVVQLSNLVIFVWSLLCFDFFLRQLWIRMKHRDHATDGFMPVSETLLIVVGYVLFIWSSLRLIRIHTTSPDLLLSGFVYAAFGLILRIRGGSRRWSTFLMLGVVLGIGYWVKTPMFIFAFVFLMVATALVGRLGIPRIAVAFGVFLLLTMPLVVLLSGINDRMTIGNSGAYLYSRTVNSIAVPVHWQGGSPKVGTPQNPTRMILDSPAVYEFGSPVGGTYPPWQDPYYWFEGVRPHVDLEGQVRVLRKSIATYAEIFGSVDPSIYLALLLLAYVGNRRTLLARDLLAQGFLFLPVVVALGLYALIVVEPRYTGPFVVVAVLGCCASIKVQVSALTRRLMNALAAIIVVVWLWSLATQEFHGGRSAIGAAKSALAGVAVLSKESMSSTPWKVVQALKALGMNKGDKVGYIGESFRFHWARLAGVRVVAEIRQTGRIGSPASWAADTTLQQLQASSMRHVDKFWHADSLLRSRVMDAFSMAGVKVIVTDSLPPNALSAGWQHVPTTGFYLYPLQAVSEKATSVN